MCCIGSRASVAGIVLGLAMVVSAAAGQCTQHVTTNLFDTFRATGNPNPGAEAPSGSAWKFYSGNPGGTPLVGSQSSSLPSGVTWYGRPDRPFLIPTVGPIYSPTASINQNPFYDRAPRHNGLMVHPGNTASEDSIVAFTPQLPVIVYGMTADVDVLGNVSDGVLVSFGDVTGGVMHNGATTLVPYGTTNVTTVSASLAAPLSLVPGETVYFRVNQRNNPNEDWANCNVFIEFSGGPVIIAPPQVSNGCINQTTVLSITAAGSGTLSYQWRKAGVPLSNGPHFSGVTTREMSILGVRPEDDGQYDCVVTGACGPLTSAPTSVAICAANFNCDGAVDFFDYLDFVDTFSSSGPGADFNADGVVDFFDYLDFVDAFSTGCN